MKRSWLGCWFDLIKMKLMFWKEGLPIPRRHSCHCEEMFVCPECQRELDFNKLKFENLGKNLVSWTCPHCHFVSKNLQCPSCGCLSPENIARKDHSWTCTACLSTHPI